MKKTIINASLFCLIFMVLLVPARTNVTCGKHCYKNSTEIKKTNSPNKKELANDDPKAFEVTLIHTLLVL